jgi:hypothetical protein
VSVSSDRPPRSAGYPRRVRRLVLLAGIVAALTACGSSASPAKPFQITFGISGGNVVPWKLVVDRDGIVRATYGTHVTVRGRWSKAKRARLLQDVQAAFAAGLKSRQCPGTLPDFAGRYIRTEHEVARVHGDCEPAFAKLWSELVRASGHLIPLGAAR